MRNLTIILLISSVLVFSGCVSFVASSAGYADLKAKYSKQYNGYKASVEAANIEKQNNGEPVEQVKEFKEWVQGQPLTWNDIKILRFFGVINKEESLRLREKQKERS
ncbi:MAG: hypothetical protein PHO70_06700 [Candidatus Omnitrophica bacterium]|nr:hypothetical protein [Candidatus Omnitrophota bacterium]